MFVIGFRDYVSSTNNLLNGRYGQSKWDASQAVEKIIKGLRNIAGVGNQTDTEKKERAWSLHLLSEMAEPLIELDIEIEENLLSYAQCQPNVRYGNRPVSREDCLCTNCAVLRITKALSENGNVKPLLKEDAAAMQREKSS